MKSGLLNAQLPELQYAEERLAVVALLVVERPSPLLSSGGDEIQTTFDWAAPRHLGGWGRPPATAAHTFDWDGGTWQRVSVDIAVALECLDAMKESPPVMFQWARFSVRSLTVVGPKAARAPWWDWTLKGRVDEDPPSNSDAWKEHRVIAVSRILNALRPFVTHRPSLIARGSLLMGSLMHTPAQMMAFLDADEIAEVERRVL